MTCYIRLRTHRTTGNCGSKGSGQKRHVITISTVLKKNVDLSVSKIFHFRDVLIVTNFRVSKNREVLAIFS